VDLGIALFDDMQIEGKLTIYDKGFDEDSHSWGEYIARAGESFSPRISSAEPLRLECEHFVECIRSGATPRSDGVVWNKADFEEDGTHPSQSGESKVAGLLMDFFKNSPYTRCWFLVNQYCL